MTHTQKILAIVLFGIIYGLAAWLVLHETTSPNFNLCPLCGK